MTDADKAQPSSPEKPENTEPKLTKQSTEKPPKSNVSTKPANQVDTKPQSLGLVWFVVLLNLVLIGTIGGAGAWYYWNKLRHTDSQVAAAVTSVEQQTQAVQTLQRNQDIQLKAQQEQSATLDASLGQTADQLALANQRLETQQQVINNLQLQLAEIGGRRPSDWLLAEADYLVRIAGRKLWLEADERSALMMLKEADKRLADLADPSLLPIRQLLAEDIQALQQINPTSLTSVALSLSGMLPLIEALPVDALRLPDPEPGQEVQALTNSISDWRENLSRSWDALVEDFITIKRRETAVEPYMSEQAQWLLKEQLQLALMQAKSAAIAAQPTLYQQSLQRALHILVEDFDLEETAVQQFMAALQNLQQTEVEKPYPQQFRVQKPLEDRLDERLNALFSRGEKSL